jgi:hypothetical protein
MQRVLNFSVPRWRKLNYLGVQGNLLHGRFSTDSEVRRWPKVVVFTMGKNFVENYVPLAAPVTPVSATQNYSNAMRDAYVASAEPFPPSLMAWMRDDAFDVPHQRPASQRQFFYNDNLFVGGTPRQFNGTDRPFVFMTGNSFWAPQPVVECLGCFDIAQHYHELHGQQLYYWPYNRFKALGVSTTRLSALQNDDPNALLLAIETTGIDGYFQSIPVVGEPSTWCEYTYNISSSGTAEAGIEDPRRYTPQTVRIAKAPDVRENLIRCGVPSNRPEMIGPAFVNLLLEVVTNYDNDFQQMVKRTRRFAITLDGSCPPGKETDGSTCVPCMSGHYTVGLGTPGTLPLNASQCVACAPGRYQGAPGKAFCLPCTAGHECPGATSTPRECSAGLFSDSLGQSACTLCSIGRFSASVEATTCTDCVPGFFSDVGLGATTCSSCSTGEFSELPASTTCSVCAIGSASADLNSPSCAPCSPGSFTAVPGSTECTSCDIFSFASASGASACTACTPNSRSRVAAVSADECLCDKDFFSVAGDAACTACPPGATCVGGVALPVARPGFWASAADPLDFVACIPEEACPGGPIVTTAAADASVLCADGYTGAACGECVTLEYYRVGTFCYKCPETPAVLWILLLLLALLLCVAILRLSRANVSTITGLSIALSFTQLIAIFGSFPVSWPCTYL